MKHRAQETPAMPPEPSPAPLIPRLVNCRPCKGRGGLPVVSCDACAFFCRALGKPEGGWQDMDALTRWTFPCGHPTMPHNVLHGWMPCQDCKGSGQVIERRTEAQWARRDTREALQLKRGQSQAVLLMVSHGAALGYSQAFLKMLLKTLPTCGARGKRTGKPCPRRVVLGAMRCHFHGAGGGPKTQAGRDAIAAARRKATALPPI